ncbi:MAG: hypothetical protein AAGA78_18345, partial [Pseudomonadota bacterium]
MRRIFALGLLLLPTPALADTLTVEFTYEVFFVAPFDTQPGGSFDPTLVSLAAPFTPGKTFSASYSYDLGQADQNPDPLRGTYSL